MKSLIVALVIAFMFDACDSKIIQPEKLIGKWHPAYQIQTKTSDGIWEPWTTINTFVALPSLEFTAKGEFLTDGNPGAQCCYAGNKFMVINNIITFSETKSCPQVKCANCSEWSIQSLDSDTLVLEVCNSRSKYIRGK